jgi:hypothetical protein
MQATPCSKQHHHIGTQHHHTKTQHRCIILSYFFNSFCSKLFSSLCVYIFNCSPCKWKIMRFYCHYKCCCDTIAVQMYVIAVIVVNVYYCYCYCKCLLLFVVLMERRSINYKLLWGFMKAITMSSSFNFPSVSFHLKGTIHALGEAKSWSWNGVARGDEYQFVSCTKNLATTIAIRELQLHVFYSWKIYYNLWFQSFFHCKLVI